MSRSHTPPPIQLSQWLDTMPMIDEPAVAMAFTLPVHVAYAMRCNYVRRLRARGDWHRARKLSSLWGL